MLWMGLSWFRALMATNETMVVQLGLAMMPLWRRASSGLISGITSGTLGSMRKALELSTNTAPALTMAGAKRLAMSFSAAPSTMSIPSKALSSAGCTVSSRPCQSSFCPAERGEASSRSSSTGKLRSASIFIISRPTAPVAPRMATFIVWFLLILQSCRTGHGWHAQSRCRPRQR